jgi:hypothetical protein
VTRPRWPACSAVSETRPGRTLKQRNHAPTSAAAEQHLAPLL